MLVPCIKGCFRYMHLVFCCKDCMVGVEGVITNQRVA